MGAAQGGIASLENVTIGEIPRDKASANCHVQKACQVVSQELEVT